MKLYVRADTIDPLDEDRQLKFTMAADPNTRLATLRRLANDPDDMVRSCVASNPAAPLDLLESLIDSHGARYEISRRDDVPDDFLRKYADKYEDFAWGLCRRSACTPEELAKFYELYNEAPHSTGLMMHIAKNRNTPPEVLDKLANYPDTAYMVLGNVANNPNTSFDTLEWILSKPDKGMSSDTYKLVGHAALRNLEKRDRQHYIDVLARLSMSPKWKVRKLAASDMNTPLIHLDRLCSDDPVSYVRKEAGETIEMRRRFGRL